MGIIQYGEPTKLEAMARRLAHKSALITGAGSGIGFATVLAFLDEGADVLAGIYAADEQEPLEQAARDRAGRLTFAQADLADAGSGDALVEAALEAYGRLDILVNMAGIVINAKATETTVENWDRQLDVNCRGAWLCAKAAIPHMQRQGKGSIVNVASINGIRGNHALVAYAASKGGMVAMTMAMAIDHAPENIRVNAVCPATIEDTGQYRQGMREAEDQDKQQGYLLAKHPMGRLGRPEEVAAAIVFLASDEASFITGHALPIDGGRSIR